MEEEEHQTKAPLWHDLLLLLRSIFYPRNLLFFTWGSNRVEDYSFSAGADQAFPFPFFFFQRKKTPPSFTFSLRFGEGKGEL